MRERLSQSTSGFPPRQRGGFIAPPERACERVTFPGFASRVSLEGRQSRILSLTVKRFPGFTARPSLEGHSLVCNRVRIRVFPGLRRPGFIAVGAR